MRYSTGALTSFRESRLARAIALVGSGTAILAAAGLVFATSGGNNARVVPGNSSDPDGTANLVLQPNSLDQMLAESELVVVGRFTGKVVGTAIVYPPNVDEQTAKGVDPERVGGVQFTDLEFQVSEFLKGGGSNSLSIRWPGDLIATDGLSYYPKPAAGRTMTLFLAADPNTPGTWGAYRAMWSTVVEKDGKLRYHDSAETEIPFLRGKSLNELQSDVRARVAAGK
jgi:hypothetical protein